MLFFFQTLSFSKDLSSFGLAQLFSKDFAQFSDGLRYQLTTFLNFKICNGYFTSLYFVQNDERLLSNDLEIYRKTCKMEYVLTIFLFEIH